MKFAFMIMGKFDSNHDRAEIKKGAAQMIGVSSLKEACRVAKELAESGVQCIELCGAFGENAAKMIAKETGGKVVVGYVVNLSEQEELCKELFGKVSVVSRRCEEDVQD